MNKYKAQISLVIALWCMAFMMLRSIFAETIFEKAAALIMCGVIAAAYIVTGWDGPEE